MKKLIDLIENLGEQANFSAYSETEIAELLKAEDVSEQLIEALLNADQRVLAEMLDARPKIVAFLAPAEDDDADENEEQDEQDESEKENTQKSNQQARIVA
ncbi:hypothetical protein [Aliikangiella maris]|uniref:Uncharacterized protein n=2 Tax=Aliikangiella maris TaxID=3162458 RepID=A0ABV2BP27_9GAMM